jgi:hypothetical protein
MDHSQIDISDQLRSCIHNAPISRYRISKITGVPEAVLSRFMAGKSGMSLVTIDKIGKVLNLSIIMDASKHKGNR